MSDLLAPEDFELEKFTADDHDDARRTRCGIDSVLESIKAQELGLATNYAKLGSLLLHYREKKFWILDGHRSFGSYIESLRQRIDKGRTQLYQCISVAEKLLPCVSENDLSQMGISKAIALKTFVTQTGRRPTDDLVQKAVDPNVGVHDLRAAVYQEGHIHVYNEPATFLDLGGFYATKGERAEIAKAHELAERIDPPVPQDWPHNERTKEIHLRLCREFISTYEEAFRRGDA